MGYLCANFSLPRPLCSRVRPDVRDRQIDRRQTKASLNVSALRGRGIINNAACHFAYDVSMNVSYADMLLIGLSASGASLIRL